MCGKSTHPGVQSALAAAPASAWGRVLRAAEMSQPGVLVAFSSRGFVLLEKLCEAPRRGGSTLDQHVQPS